MVDGTTKQKLLKEIEKFGNVYLSCLKIGIGKATYYRWKQNDEKFRGLADEAERIGRENISEVAEYALLQNVKKGDQRAIEFALKHISERYKQKPISNVVIVHKKEIPVSDTSTVKTLEDLFDDYKDNGLDRAKNLYERLTQYGKKIPNKPDGTPIDITELHQYLAYITDWQEWKEKEEQKKRIEDFEKYGVAAMDPNFKRPEPDTNKPPAESKEKQKPENNVV